jgi:homoserine O-succinyltransferase
MRTERFSLAAGERFGTVLKIGLVNNMPDAALRAGELQFARLLKQAAGALEVRLHLFSMAGIERGAAARARMEGFYDDAASLPQAELDALIVTGAEPTATELRGEPYWGELADIIDWAQEGVLSSVFSCLAAHAAVLHLDSIARVPLPQKLSGVFQSERVEEDVLFTGLPPIYAVPHSRRNGVSERDLLARGYRVLTRMPYGDPDIAVKPGPGLMLLLQGHPEHDPDTLGREFLYETARFLRGENGERPAMPENYFDRATEEILHELAGHASDTAILPRYREVVSKAIPLHTWRGAAVKLFANWLTLVAAEKTRRAIAARSVRKRARA